jgi:hypothetical protein
VPVTHRTCARGDLFKNDDFTLRLREFKPVIIPVHLMGSNGGCSMYFAAAVLAVLAGLFYAAGNHEIGSWGVEMCRYGSTFCDSPSYVLAAAILAGLWGGFVSIR